jgi:hypothetical protein
MTLIRSASAPALTTLGTSPPAVAPSAARAANPVATEQAQQLPPRHALAEQQDKPENTFDQAVERHMLRQFEDMLQASKKQDAAIKAAREEQKKEDEEDFPEDG